jgi:hypothetical protein
MPNYTFENFEEVENNVIKEAPKIVYKYRADWNNQYHRELITEKKLWFAPPRELNDPFDIRIQLKFSADEINNPIFFEKLKKHLPLTTKERLIPKEIYKPFAKTK